MKMAFPKNVEITKSERIWSGEEQVNEAVWEMTKMRKVVCPSHTNVKGQRFCRKTMVWRWQREARKISTLPLGS